MTKHVIYGSDSGATRGIAKKIAAKLDAEVFDVKRVTVAEFENCDLLVLGVPTYGDGTLQDDWDAALDTLRAANLEGKKVALFGLGDQMGYPDTFVDAIGILYDELIEKQAEIIGQTATDGYEFEDSLAVRDGVFVGLALDQDNQSSMSTNRIAAWTSQLP
ncbi:flavodoxin FldA [Consotaella aegiceratis]|uniref:flavodoxin FldA n=1 Tax=Consotaella aegiceratis TaxID=3097961 RepID=UPI002F421DFE